jgi:hypothetical protein
MRIELVPAGEAPIKDERTLYVYRCTEDGLEHFRPAILCWPLRTSESMALQVLDAHGGTITSRSVETREEAVSVGCEIVENYLANNPGGA